MVRYNGLVWSNIAVTLLLPSYIYDPWIFVLYNPSHLSPPPVLSVQNIISYQTCILLAVDPRIPAQPVNPDHNKQQSECQYSIVI